MKFIETYLKGAYIIESEAISDHRGSFARIFCCQEFKKNNLTGTMVQTNLSISLKRFTLRGMHYQVGECAEDKLVRCIRGKILDVILDIRPGSETFGHNFMVELSEQNQRAIYVPKNFAHGFLTLVDNCHVLYQVSNYYSPTNERGIRWNDSFFKISWPTSNPIISEKDSQYQDFNP